MGRHELTRDQRTTSRVRRARRSACLVGLALIVGMAGCRPAPLAFPASLNSQRPEERVRAAKEAVSHPYASDQERRAVMEMLVARLEDDDDAVRLFAILALDRMTGTRLGYSYHAPPDQRVRAVQAWRRYLAQQAEASAADGSSGPISSAQRPGDAGSNGPRPGGPR